jgi:hypothetical protein
MDINNIFDIADMKTFLTNLNWKDGILGAILGYILTNLHIAYIFLKELTKSQYKTYYGEYYIYSWSVANIGKISEKKLLISKSISGKPNIKIIIKENIDLNYSGKMQINGKNLYFNLLGEKHTEELKIIFHEPLEKKINLLIGVFSAITVDLDPFSAKIIISKNRLDYENAKKYLGKRNLIIIDSKHQRNEIFIDKIEKNNIINNNI